MQKIIQKNKFQNTPSEINFRKGSFIWLMIMGIGLFFINFVDFYYISFVQFIILLSFMISLFIFGLFFVIKGRNLRKQGK